ncbi:MAG: four helix bundle protein [Pirellulales bacterium]|nr:four helix bundle protein [Pirellulales bacterium]
MQDFTKLAVWEKSHHLTLAVYEKTSCFPNSERYGITSQLRRASASIPANVAEGCGRAGGADFVRFLNIAMGSASEVSYHLMLARDLEMLEAQDYDDLAGRIDEIKRMLFGLIKKLKSEN